MTVLSGLIELIASIYPPDVADAVRAEIPHLRSRAFRLALELQDAEERGVTYSQAACVPTEFPLIARLHHDVIAILSADLPTEALQAIGDAIGRAPEVNTDGIREALAEGARAETYEGALLRFLIYQTARVERWVRTWDQPAFEANGALGRLDEEADKRLAYWLLMPTPLAGVRPLSVACADLLVRLEQVASGLRVDLENAASETLERFQLLLCRHPLAGGVVSRRCGDPKSVRADPR